MHDPGPGPRSSSGGAPIRFLVLLAFIAVPLGEIAIFIKVGSLIGLWPTLASIVATAILGVALLRRQGLATLAKAQQSLDQGGIPLDAMFHGILLLVPAVRLWAGRRAWNMVKSSREVQVTIDGTWERTAHPPEREARQRPARPAIEGGAGEDGSSPWRTNGKDNQ